MTSKQGHMLIIIELIGFSLCMETVSHKNLCFENPFKSKFIFWFFVLKNLCKNFRVLLTNSTQIKIEAQIHLYRFSASPHTCRLFLLIYLHDMSVDLRPSYNYLALSLPFLITITSVYLEYRMNFQSYFISVWN